ncbi:LOB domain-containing protein 12-like [Benincasa hispida]|uniref:LOB domain-containing protein 12-like n=1 Tax=Benincasa hispida TaxID=102211 RepID=UPI001901034E|nr:LOB domain-containing protein 12-like [Benincasa hispida]
MRRSRSSSSPCASCKQLRRRCSKDCIFSPYFPPHDPLKFSIVHKVFGASNLSKMLQELPVHQRTDAVNSLVYEASARIHDPVYGCVRTISFLQNQLFELQTQLSEAQLLVQMQQSSPTLVQHQNPSFHFSPTTNNNSLNSNQFSDQSPEFASSSSVMQYFCHNLDSL